MKRREAHWTGHQYELDDWVSEDGNNWKTRSGEIPCGLEWDQVASIDLKGGPRDGVTVY